MRTVHHTLLPLTAGELDADPRRAATLLALNNAHPAELSLLDPAAFAALVRQAVYARQIDAAAGFLIALDHKAQYGSPNFVWFRRRYERFVYIDRIVIAPALRGRGAAAALYRDLFAWARNAGYERIVCEVAAVPPNPASDAFHASFGFAAVGAAVIDGGAKTVRYFARDLEGAGAP